jgi:hypothetical protein
MNLDRGSMHLRIGPFLLVEDADGCRHVMRPSVILCISDADPGRTETVVQLPGGRRILLLSALDDVMAAIEPSLA